LGVSYKNGLVTPTWILSSINCRLNILFHGNPISTPCSADTNERDSTPNTLRSPRPTRLNRHPRIARHVQTPPSPVKLARTRFTNHSRHDMCYWYKHDYSCKHVTYALGRYCSAANLIQTPCKKRNIWQTIRMGEECEECAMPEGRGHAAGYDGVPEQQHKGGVKAKKGRKR
jgi:hypothetical protein